MTDRDLSPDAAHALALALKPREMLLLRCGGCGERCSQRASRCGTGSRRY